MEKEAGRAFVHRWDTSLLYVFFYLLLFFVFFLQEDLISNMFDRPGERLAYDVFVLCYACFIPSHLGG